MSWLIRNKNKAKEVEKISDFLKYNKQWLRHLPRPKRLMKEQEKNKITEIIETRDEVTTEIIVKFLTRGTPQFSSLPSEERQKRIKLLGLIHKEEDWWEKIKGKYNVDERVINQIKEYIKKENIILEELN